MPVEAPEAEAAEARRTRRGGGRGRGPRPRRSPRLSAEEAAEERRRPSGGRGEPAAETEAAADADAEAPEAGETEDSAASEDAEDEEPAEAGDSDEDGSLKLAIPKPKGKGGGLVELVVIVALALGLALAIQAWLVKPYQIPSESMEPTLDVGQRVLVNRFIYHFTDPTIGDIVVFHPPAGADNGDRMRRPAPQTGEAVPEADREPSRARTSSSGSSPGRATRSRSKNGHPVVNGSREDRRVLHHPCGGARRLQHAEDDHDSARPLLHDGRQPWSKRRQPLLGTRPRDWIIGKAFATYWPPDRIGIL